jgi:hypothetical protein
MTRKVVKCNHTYRTKFVTYYLLLLRINEDCYTNKLCNKTFVVVLHNEVEMFSDGLIDLSNDSI